MIQEVSGMDSSRPRLPAPAKTTPPCSTKYRAAAWMVLLPATLWKLMLATRAPLSAAQTRALARVDEKAEPESAVTRIGMMRAFQATDATPSELKATAPATPATRVP